MGRTEQRGKVVMKATFKEGNDILYGQDMGFHRGIPPGIAFDVIDMGPAPDKGKTLYKLVARGYGILGHGGDDYGNGALYVRC